MSALSTGDMAQAYLLRRHNYDLKTTLNRLTEELGSGRKSDLAAAVSGDFKTLAGLEQSLKTMQAYATATTEAATLTGTLQSAFETVQSIATGLAPSLMSAGTSGGMTHVRTAAFDAGQKLFSAVAALNVRVGDRYALSGVATDQKPILGAQDILDELTTAIAGQVTSSGVEAAVTAWFDAAPGGGGYVDTIYGGSSTPLAPFSIGEGEVAVMDITATDQTLKDTLKGLALGALVAQGALAGDLTGQANLLQSAGRGLMTANTNLAELRANLGSVEGQIGAVATRNTVEKSALEIARNGIVAADPYATAAELEAVKTQLETLYTLTARLSRMSLADFLR